MTLNGTESESDQIACLGITACSNSKVGNTTEKTTYEAQNLYDSWLFDGRVNALKANCDDWIIFSGKYGCLEPTDEIPCYDQKISDQPEEKQYELARQITTYAADRGVDEVVILMGRDYAQLLKETIDPSITIRDPLEGVDLFAQREELKILARKGLDDKKTGQLTLASDDFK